MNNFVLRTQPVRSTESSGSHAAQELPKQLWLAALLGAVLLAAPRTRIVFIAPIYLIDVLALILLILPPHGRVYRWTPKTPIFRVVLVYIGTILVSESRGMFAYGTVIEPIYMMLRYMLAVSLFFTIPRLVAQPGHINYLLKGIMLGTLFSAVIVILYSLGPTRSLVVNVFYANDFVNPGWQRLLAKIAIYGAGESAMRGRSLVGAATMTAGFLSITWPLAFLAYHRLKEDFMWKRLALVTIVLSPVAVLMTYGRGAWIMVGVVIALIAVFGLASGRKILLAVLIGGTIAATQLDIDSDLFYFDRVLSQTRVSMDNPLDDVSTSERLLSFIEPFEHLAANPSWLFFGAGQAGSKMKDRGELGTQLYDEIGLATHSAFAKSYYNFGAIAAICQVLIVFLGFRFVLVRALRTPTSNRDQRMIWQSLLMSWCTYSLWWASGHAMIGEPRGVMLSFLLFGLISAFEKLRLFEISTKQKNTVYN